MASNISKRAFVDSNTIRSEENCVLLREALSATDNDTFTIILKAPYINTLSDRTTYIGRQDVEEFLDFNKATSPMMYFYVE